MEPWNNGCRLPNRFVFGFRTAQFPTLPVDTH